MAQEGSEENSLNISDQGLKDLLAKALKDVQDDVAEADKHVKAIAKKIENPDQRSALEIYSIMYQEALKVKGVVRERHIKLIKMIQDRIRIREVMDQSKGSVPWMLTPDAIQDLVEKAGKDTDEDK